MNVALWAEIRRLTEVEKLSQRAIARRLHCCDKTIRKALAMEQPPPRRPAKPRRSILDPYHAQIDALIKKYPELSAVRVLEEISKGDEGYQGSISLVRRYLRQTLCLPKISSALPCKELRHLAKLAPCVRMTDSSNQERSEAGDFATSGKRPPCQGFVHPEASQ